MYNADHYKRILLNQIRQHIPDLSEDLHVSDIPILVAVYPDEKARFQTWAAHSLLYCLTDLTVSNREDRKLTAFRCLLQAHEYRGRCGGWLPSGMSDVMTAIQQEIEKEIRDT